VRDYCNVATGSQLDAAQLDLLTQWVIEAGTSLGANLKFDFPNAKAPALSCGTGCGSPKTEPHGPIPPISPVYGRSTGGRRKADECREVADKLPHQNRKPRCYGLPKRGCAGLSIASE
jgi:hypothetical protein